MHQSAQTDRYGYAQNDFLYFDGICEPADDMLIDHGEVKQLFVAAFGYKKSSYRKYNHKNLVERDFYRAHYGYNVYREGEGSEITRYLKSRVIALIREIKRSVATGIAPRYPHDTIRPHLHPSVSVKKAQKPEEPAQESENRTFDPDAPLEDLERDILA